MFIGYANIIRKVQFALSIIVFVPSELANNCFAVIVVVSSLLVSALQGYAVHTAFSTLFSREGCAELNVYPVALAWKPMQEFGQMS
jgi:hypothetical protein